CARDGTPYYGGRFDVW
nr:immunoglobulin heavy chain junction region [Macaca mulatta]MOW99431.1 immunoglobulin heavy chain junction region [Macaca mulatta]MOX00153.1 immunoglobulin heavy chain junction region [Macaca mulatta]MOX00255.1 immunoglobulin heavy chain junction region [Macaca mulatta]MOX00300.1 immunoglobulin heavy chain junction region [Macaca mulatta]